MNGQESVWETKAAITDVLYRYCRATDRGDWDLLATVYHDGAIEHHGRFDGPASDFLDFVKAAAGTAVIWQHHLSTINIDVVGDVAYSEAYYHCPCLMPADEDGVQLVMELLGRYVDRFELRHGEWRIAERLAILDLRRDSVAEESAFTAQFARGTRDQTDPSFRPGLTRPTSAVTV